MANTPGYILRTFRAQEEVERLSRSHTVEELIETIREIDLMDAPRISNLITAYVAAVALTYKKSGAYIRSLASLPLRRLHWVPRIINLWEAEGSSTTDVVLRFELQNVVTNGDSRKVDAASTTQITI